MSGPSLQLSPPPIMSAAEFCRSPRSANSCRLISFNIQVGINTQAYHHYLTRSWQHLLPSFGRNQNLKRIANILQHFDVAGIQEADGGSIRSGFINQVKYLAEHSQMPYWYQQLNRNIGLVAQHSNGVLSRYEPVQVEDHKLPGYLPGRGAVLCRFGDADNYLTVIVMHLALGGSAQDRQIGYVRELIGDNKNIVLMGDMNAHAEHLLTRSALQDVDLHPVQEGLHTFPSWQPDRGLDHILVSSDVKVNQVAVLNERISDHLPIAMDICLPNK